MDRVEWVVLLPVKTARTAKSRLAPAFPDPEQLATLVRAMRRDTVEAVRNTRAVVGIVAAVDRVDAAADLGAGIDVVVQRDSGLNAALREADTFARLRFPELGRIAVVGDLPALTPDALRAVLRAAEGHPRSFVPDLAGTGTTMLAVTSGPLDPRFGPGSAARHAETATTLSAAVSARHDVDVVGDLAPSMVSGFGSATRGVLAGLPAPPERVGCPGT